MKVKMTSILSGITRERDMDITDEQIALWQGGTLIQDAFPQLTEDEREFLMTGITPEEWDAEFGGEE